MQDVKETLCLIARLCLEVIKYKTRKNLLLDGDVHEVSNYDIIVQYLIAI